MISLATAADRLAKHAGRSALQISILMDSTPAVLLRVVSFFFNTDGNFTLSFQPSNLVSNVSPFFCISHVKRSGKD